MVTYNGYSFQDRTSLRQALKFFYDLEACAKQGDTTSATIVVDVVNALEAISPRARLAIRLHLIQNIPAPMVAEEMGIVVRTVYERVDEGLTTILAYLESGLVFGWPETQLDFIRRNCGTMSNEELGPFVGRSAKAVANKISRLRGQGERLNRSSSRQIA